MFYSLLSFSQLNNCFVIDFFSHNENKKNFFGIPWTFLKFTRLLLSILFIINTVIKIRISLFTLRFDFKSLTQREVCTLAVFKFIQTLPIDYICKGKDNAIKIMVVLVRTGYIT